MARTIEIDSRAAGQGKTTQGIYPRIRHLLSMNEKILLVVPSIDLQHQYHKEFGHISDFYYINYTTTDTRVFDSAVSVSSSNTGVIKSTINSLVSNTRTIVCITHQCWLQLNLTPQIRQQWNLIIDEVVKPLDTVNWQRARNAVDWSPIVILPEHFDSASHPDNWWPVKFDVDLSDSWLSSIADLRKLNNPNWIIRARTSSINNMTADQAGRIEFVRELDPVVLQDWMSVFVAAAAFESTFMGVWVHRHGFTVLDNENPFVPVHYGVAHFHAPVQQDFRWTNYRRKANPYIHDYYAAEVNRIRRENNITDIVTVRNNGSDVELDHEQRLKHNCHGQNQFQHVTAASCESALIPSPIFDSFLKEEMGMSHQQIVTAYCAYEFYQMIMRIALRDRTNTQRCDIFLLDAEVGQYLMAFFDLDQVEVSHDIDLKISERPVRLTNAEKCVKYRERKKLKTSEVLQQLRDDTGNSQ